MLDLCKNKMCEQTSYIAYCSYSKPDKINQLVYCKDCKVQFKNTLIWVKGMFIWRQVTQLPELLALPGWKNMLFIWNRVTSVFIYI